MPQETGGVQSVERIFTIIETLAAHPGGVGLQQLAGECKLAKSTAHRLLASLIQLGYAVQDSFSTKYRLTLKMFELSSGIVNDMDVMGIARPHLDRLANRVGEAVHLVIRDGADIVYIYKAEAGGMRMSSRVGMRSPMYCTGVGKAILASLSYAEVEEVWQQSSRKKLTEHTITSLPRLLEQLAQVRAQGYAVDDEENELGIRCIALALPGPAGKAEAAFSISSLVPHMGAERLAQLAVLALDTRSAILRDLGLR